MHFFRICIQWTLELIFISWITLSMTFSTSKFLWYVFIQISVHSNPVATPGESSSGAAAGRGWRAAVLPRSLCCLRVSLGSKVHFKMCTLAFLSSGEKKKQRKKKTACLLRESCFEGWCVLWQRSPMSPVTLRRCHTLPLFCLSASDGARIILALYRNVKPLPRFLTGGLGGILCQVHSYMQCNRTDFEPK